jgi:hypothetical protein
MSHKLKNNNSKSLKDIQEGAAQLAIDELCWLTLIIEKSFGATGLEATLATAYLVNSLQEQLETNLELQEEIMRIIQLKKEELSNYGHK